MALVLTGNRPHKRARILYPRIDSHVLRNQIVSLQRKCGQDVSSSLDRVSYM